MSKKKTNVDLILALPAAMTRAVIETMTPDQKSTLSASQAGQIASITTEAAGKIAVIFDQEAGPTAGADPRD